MDGQPSGVGLTKLFLMYRVELKVSFSASSKTTVKEVPNVPCGVERLPVLQSRGAHPVRKFLMYRVELKAYQAIKILYADTPVPNVPCGVESLPAIQIPAHASRVESS